MRIEDVNAVPSECRLAAPVGAVDVVVTVAEVVSIAAVSVAWDSGDTAAAAVAVPNVVSRGCAVAVVGDGTDPTLIDVVVAACAAGVRVVETVDGGSVHGVVVVVDSGVCPADKEDNLSRGASTLPHIIAMRSSSSSSQSASRASCTVVSTPFVLAVPPGALALVITALATYCCRGSLRRL